MATRGVSLGALILVVWCLCALLPEVASARQRLDRSGCRAQKPQSFLMRHNYVKHNMIDPKAHARAVRYRAEAYGSIPGVPATEFNPTRVASQVTHMKFFGLPIDMHEKVAPVLSCVEQRILQKCSGPKSHYTPRAIGGLRTQNTFRQGEISNHLFGIAIDIDPERNPCCHCVAKWQTNKKCRIPSSSPYERADLPRCWVEAFEHYGFYWLGLDTLEDTMHFEFLGQPD